MLTGGTSLTHRPRELPASRGSGAAEEDKGLMSSVFPAVVAAFSFSHFLLLK